MNLFFLNKAIEVGKKEGYSRKLFTSLVKTLASDLTFSDKIKEATKWPNFNYKQAEEIIRNLSDKKEYEDNWKFILLKEFPAGIRKTEQNIEDMKDRAQKFSSKPLKLESMLESLSKELLTAPPHYEIDGYKIILTPDINVNNYSQFVNTFRAGRIISSGKVSEMNDDFSQELIYKTMNKNKLKIDNNFYFVIFEGLN